MPAKTTTKKKFDAAYYAEHFAAIKPPMLPEEAMAESLRCLYCYDAPCVQACPTHIEIPRFIKQISTKDLFGSAKTILEANALGHSCAKVCPTQVLCEGACVFHDWQEKPIDIGRLQAYATDALHASGQKPFAPGSDTGKKVAVVGAGPAGLCAAYYLRRLGHAVTLFERRPLSGGLNTYGVAEYKMTQQDAQNEARFILDMKVTLRTGVEIGKTLPFSKLENDFDAVFIGFGLGATRRLGLDGEDLIGSMEALSFIEYVKNRNPQDLPPSAATIVIGAGNTSIDAVTQSKRIGVPKVVMAYRRSEDDMSAYEFEYAHAKHDGVEFLWNAAPTRILGKKKVEGVEFLRTETKGGKLALVKGSEFTVACDRVIRAIGQQKHLGIAKSAGLELSEDGRLKVNPQTLQASKHKVFAGGDAVNGGREVVNAAADGKRAAWHMHKFLTGAEIPAARDARWVRTIEGERLAPIPRRGRHD